jgi:hypothetical protein
MNEFDPDALMKAQAERMKRAQAAAEAVLRSAGRASDRNWRAEEAARGVLTQENPAARSHVIGDEARRARELAEIAIGKESLADPQPPPQASKESQPSAQLAPVGHPLKSGTTSGDPRAPDLDFALPPELTELVSEATQHEIRIEVLQIHAKLLNHDPEFKDCADNGRHLQALFEILASKLSDRADFDNLLDLSIPAMVAAIKSELGWRWPSGDPEMLKKAFLLGSILRWRLNAKRPTAIPDGNAGIDHSQVRAMEENPVKSAEPVSATQNTLARGQPTRPTPDQTAIAEKLVAEQQDVDTRTAACWLRCTSQHILRLVRESKLIASSTRPKRITTESLRAHKWRKRSEPQHKLARET